MTHKTQGRLTYFVGSFTFSFVLSFFIFFESGGWQAVLGMGTFFSIFSLLFFLVVFAFSGGDV